MSMLDGKGKEPTSSCYRRLRSSESSRFCARSCSVVPQKLIYRFLFHLSMDYFSEALWKIWEARPADRKFSLVCIPRSASLLPPMPFARSKTDLILLDLPFR